MRRGRHYGGVAFNEFDRERCDTIAKTRAAEIVATLKRLTRLSERLLQLAPSGAGRLNRDAVADLRLAARQLGV